MKRIMVKERAGVFAEDKDTAAGIREMELYPTLAAGKAVCLDFTGVDGATQSFIHAMIRGLVSKIGVEVLDRIDFKGCNDSVKGIISIVCEYSQLDAADDVSEARKSEVLRQGH
jgi:hypothetical protein